MMADVVLYSKPDCRLCEEVKAKLSKLRQTHGFNLRELNILDDPEAFEKFKDEIPVVFINGKKAFKYYLDEDRLLRRISEAS